MSTDQQTRSFFKGLMALCVCCLFVLGNTAVGQQTAEAYLAEGLKKYEEGNFIAAKKEFKAGIDLDPANYKLIKGMADCQHKEGQFSDAIDNYTRASHLNEEDDELYFHMAAAKISLSRFKEANRDLTKAIDINPNVADYYYFRGNVRGSLWNLKSAIKDYDKAIELNPDYTDAYYNRGAAHGELGSFAKGEQDFGKAVELNPELTEGLFNVALSKYAAKNYQGAIDGFTKVINGENHLRGKAFFYRGETRYDLKDREGACVDWKMAVDLGYHDARANFNDFCGEEKKRKKGKADITF